MKSGVVYRAGCGALHCTDALAALLSNWVYFTTSDISTINNQSSLYVFKIFAEWEDFNLEWEKIPWNFPNWPNNNTLKDVKGSIILLNIVHRIRVVKARI